MYAVLEYAFEILGCQIIRMETEWTNVPWRGLMRSLGHDELESEGRFNYGYHMISDDNPLGHIYLVDGESWQQAKQGLKIKMPN
jgi:RimJ/RimL family protein N-acetyltransferase